MCELFYYMYMDIAILSWPMDCWPNFLNEIAVIDIVQNAVIKWVCWPKIWKRNLNSYWMKDTGEGRVNYVSIGLPSCCKMITLSYIMKNLYFLSKSKLKDDSLPLSCRLQFNKLLSKISLPTCESRCAYTSVIFP